MKLSRVVFLFCLILISVAIGGQPGQPTEPVSSLRGPNDEKYLFPINPGQLNSLSGSMGELRSTHFHAGIDIRTNNGIGLPVIATKSGYISRVIVGTGGYGHAIFIQHADGNTSLYGHLSQFRGALAKYVLKEQYTEKSFDQDIFLTPSQFHVKKGDTIALSGNTGGSGGPHLHFEIRDRNNEAINPLKFGFTEIKDATPPEPYRIALKTLNESARVNDQFGRFEFMLARKGVGSGVSQSIRAKGRIGIELYAFDRMDNNRSLFGINYIEVFADSQRVFSQKIEKVSFLDQRNILITLDYKALKSRGNYFNKLYIDDGNVLKYFNGTIGKGIIDVKDKPISIRISMKDASGNESIVSFKILPDLEEKLTRLPGTTLKSIDYEVNDNILTIAQSICTNDTLRIYSKKGTQKVIPDYRASFRDIYLIDLGKNIPDSIAGCSGTLPFDFKDKVATAQPYSYFGKDVDITFPRNSLFDTLFLTVNHYVTEEKEIFNVGNPQVPLIRPIEITLKPSRDYPVSHSIGAYRIEGNNRYTYMGGDFVNNKIKFRSIEMGSFTILKDSIAPTIKRINLSRTVARFKIRDDLSGISYYEANINGHWLLMKYDYKTGLLEAERQDKSLPLQGDFELKVVDYSGNEEIYKENIP